MNNFDEWFSKSLVIAAILIFFAPMFFLLNLLSNQNMWVFVAVIFGCNIIYDSIKKVVSAQIGTIAEWWTVIKFAWWGLSLIVVSFVGIYIDIFVFKYVGVSLIWFPSFLWGMWLVTRAEETFKASNTSN